MRKILNSELGRLTPQQALVAAKLPVVVVLDNIRSSNNVGSFFRTADAFGVEQIVLCGISATPPSKDIHKTALGAELVVPWRHFISNVEAIEQLRAEGYRIVVIEQVEGSLGLDEFHPTFGQSYALVFGNEVAGVDQAIVDLADLAIEIPQVGTKHSLNVAVTGGAVLWDIFSKYRTFAK